jgi:hypothetical protein
VPDAEEKPLAVSTSTPPDLPLKQQQLFRDVLNKLNQCGVPYAVSGAFALRQHTGICRDTKDLDVFLPAADVKSALECLVADGFDCEVRDPVWLAKAHRGDFFVDLICGMSNGVIVVDRSWITRASPTTIFGVDVRVLAPEELIASKLFVTRRERFDGADIVHVIFGTRGKLDWDRVLQIAGEHWEVVLWSLVLFHYVYPAHTAYVPQEIWTRLLKRFADQIAHPDSQAKFRGSLIDENMFHIDVHEWELDNLLAEERAKREPKLEAPEPCSADQSVAPRSAKR